MRISTERLLLSPLTRHDAAFITELLNTEGWIKNIGDRNIHSETDAKNYIKKIRENPAAAYWVVQLKDQSSPIGVVTIIKRDYLPDKDVGFAFLPRFFNKGYALEATRGILRSLAVAEDFENILAVCLPDNAASIKLIKKLGLRYEKSIREENIMLEVYKASPEELILG